MYDNIENFYNYTCSYEFTYLYSYELFPSLFSINEFSQPSTLSIYESLAI